MNVVYLKLVFKCYSALNTIIVSVTVSRTLTLIVLPVCSQCPSHAILYPQQLERELPPLIQPLVDLPNHHTGLASQGFYRLFTMFYLRTWPVTQRKSV